MINETKIRVRYGETDQMGIVYHANYFVWFDIGRTEFLRSNGMSYKELEDMNVLLPVIDVGCTYKNPALYDDEIIIKTKVSELKGVKIKFEYEVFKEEKLLSTGFTEHAFVDNTLRPINFKKKFNEIWEMLSKNME